MATNGLSMWLFLAMLVVLFGLWTRSRRLQQQSGLPEGDVIYTDTGTWFPNKELLRAEEYCLSGRPDYLVKQPGGSLIPVELKSGRSPGAPREGHVLQLAAYCLLVQESYGKRPEYGILQYEDNAYAIDYSDDLEEDLLDLIAEMREASFAGELERDHDEVSRCLGCGVRRTCHQRLS